MSTQDIPTNAMDGLSPAAQAVLDAFLKAPCDNELSVAAALRAAADQVVPEEKTTPMLESGYEVTRAKWEQRDTTRRKLLAIAAELERKQDEQPTERTL
jgi:hypothetical protein